jgi:hypothetical protein
MQKPGSLKDTQGILRHASVKTTGDIYVQLIDASVQQSVNLCPAAVLDRWQGSVEDMVNRTQYHASEQFLSARRWRIRYLPVPPPPRFATSLRAAPGNCVTCLVRMQRRSSAGERR